MYEGLEGRILVAVRLVWRPVLHTQRCRRDCSVPTCMVAGCWANDVHLADGQG
jgi:hypothetical protein